MNPSLSSYLSLRQDGEYIIGLNSQFEMARAVESYHLALFAYHLLFMTFIYQTLHKVKIWMPERFSDALIQSPAEKRKKHKDNSSIWTFSEFQESSVFELLNLLRVCEDEVSRCKKIIKFRNQGFGHATGVLVSAEEFENKVDEYDQMASEIHQLTHNDLDRIFNAYFKSIDPALELTKDDIEIDLIIPNRLSDRDLESLASECLVAPDSRKRLVMKILQDGFGVYVEEVKGIE